MWILQYVILTVTTTYQHAKKRKIDSLLVILTKVAGGLESVPAAIGQEAGYTLDKSPVCSMANTETDSYLHSHSH